MQQPDEAPDLIPAGGLRLRHPTEADYLPLVALVDEWWGGRRMHELLPRLWFQHFTGTSWIAEWGDGRIAGFLVGFISPDDPATAYCHMIAADPNLRRHGVGRALYDRFFATARGAGATRVAAVTWPGNRTSLAFHRRLGFVPDDGPGTQLLYGTPAHPGYDYGTDDRTVLVRDLADLKEPRARSEA